MTGEMKDCQSGAFRPNGLERRTGNSSALTTQKLPDS
jgi:hypothetical protein